MIKEMLRQSYPCDWVMKTSLVDIINNVRTGQEADVGPDETDLVIRAFNEFKPFSLKVRRAVAAHYIASGENLFETVDISIDDQKTLHIGLYFDRLSCNLFDDNSLDFVPLDETGFDWAPWDMPNLGTTEWRMYATFTSTINRKIYPIGVLDSLAHYRVTVVSSDGLRQPPLHSIEFFDGVLQVVFWTNPPVGETYRLERALGVASPKLLDSKPIRSTYEHNAAVLRSRYKGVGNNREATDPPCGEIDGCDTSCTDLDGGNAMERLKPEVKSTGTITVKSSFTEALCGLDAYPLDCMPFDSLSSANLRSEFFTAHGNPTSTHSTTETLPMSFVLNVGVDKTVRLSSSHNRHKIGWIEKDGQPVSFTSIADGVAVVNLAVGTEVVVYAKSVKLRQYQATILSHPIEAYTIVDWDTITMSVKPTQGSVFSIEYGFAPLSQISPLSYVPLFNFIIVSATVTDITNMVGNIVPGTKVLDTTNDRIYTREINGTWSFVANTNNVWVTSEGISYTFDGTNWTVDIEAGEVVRNYRWRGMGTASVSSALSPYGFFTDSSELLRKTGALPYVWIAQSTARLLDPIRNVMQWIDVSTNELHFLPPNSTSRPQNYSATEMNGGVTGRNGARLTSSASSPVAGMWTSGARVVLTFTTSALNGSDRGTIVGTENSGVGWSVSSGASSSSNDYAVFFRINMNNGLAIWRIESNRFVFGNMVVFEVSFDTATDVAAFRVNGVVVTPVLVQGASGGYLSGDDGVLTVLALRTNALYFDGILYEMALFITDVGNDFGATRVKLFNLT